PSLIAQANGMIRIADDDPLVLSGSGPRPALSGSVTFDRFSVLPRYARRELTFNRGSIDLSTATAGEHRTYTLAIGGVDGSLDDGQLSNIKGSLELRDGELAKASLQLDATTIPYRIPGTLDLTVTLSGMVITLDGPTANWKVGGIVTVVDG